MAKNFTDIDLSGDAEKIETKSAESAAQAAVEMIGGAIPFVGGISGWIAGKWSGKEQERANEMFLAWFQMLQSEMKEKYRVMAEIMARIELSDTETSKRVESAQYQSLVRKAFRNWSGAESSKKQKIVRNILANAASPNATSSDDVVSLFLEWIDTYSEFHFDVIAKVYGQPGITRYGIWHNLNRPIVREDSADADLFKLLIRDLSTGGVIRQYRETDYHGNFLPKRKKIRPKGSIVSAFDNNESYELTELGKQFVHYAMQEITPKIEFNPDEHL